MSDSPDSGAGIQVSSSQASALSSQEVAAVRDLLGRVKNDSWAGASLRGGMPRAKNLSALPTASKDYRNQLVLIQGGTGVADAFYICLKDASENYSWVHTEISTVQALINATALGGQLAGTISAATVNASHSGSTHASLAIAKPEWLEIMSGPGDTSSNGLHPSANAAYLTPLRPLTASATVISLVGSIGVQSGNIDVGIYSWDGSTMTKVVSLGSTACPAASTRVVYDIADTALTNGTRYYVAYAADNGTVTYSRVTYSAAVIAPTGPTLSKASSFPLPSTITSLSNASLGPHLIGALSGGATM
jgi:hypothetical protein